LVITFNFVDVGPVYGATVLPPPFLSILVAFAIIESLLLHQRLLELVEFDEGLLCVLT
jgi:hypothetical protein